MQHPGPPAPSSSQREAALFALTLEKAADERVRFVEAVCGGDAALRQRLEALLEAHQASDCVLEPETSLEADAGTRRPAALPGSAEFSDEGVGQRVGRYQLLERIGEGGWGVVYVAEQTEPIQRRVALKVIKLGMDTRAVVARFEAERQALALMDHPNIARVFDAGTTAAAESQRSTFRSPIPSGRPYFVMELVRGIKITDYCDQNHLATGERIELFIKVCHAIQHAHQKGIIHRDVKPSNILVTLHDGVPVPKVIDFGIAKATEGRLTEATVYTHLHQFIGTPAYMSPEQAEMSGLDIDTRSDIYSLGVLLYEMLAGKTPFDAQELMASGIDALRRTIREKDPARPSTRVASLSGEELSTTAQRRSSDAPKLIHLLQGDLDWIVMKCLEKDRARRYETANGLAADLRRYLGNEPVTARPPSAYYRLQKAFRRNKLAFAAAAAVMAALLAGFVAASRQALRATRAEREQSQLRERADESKILAEAARQEALASAATATARLYESLVGQARATRIARQVGYREEAFDLLKKANALNTSVKNVDELRLEAMACLGDFIGFRPRILMEHEGGEDFHGMRIAPDGRTAVVWARAGEVRLCELPSGRETLRWQPPLPVWNLVFQTAGKIWVAWCVPDGRDFFLADQSAHLAEFAQADDLSWRQTGWRAWPDLHAVGLAKERMIGLVGPPKALSLVHLGSGETQQTLTRSGGFFRPWSSDLDPRGRWLAVAVQSGEGRDAVEIWDLATGSLLKTLVSDLANFGDLRFSPGGEYLLVCSGEGSAVYRTADFELMDRIAGFVAWSGPGSFSPGRSLLSLGLQQQGRLMLRDYLKQVTLTAIQEPDLLEGVFSPDGHLLLTLSKKRLSAYPLDAAAEFQDLAGHRMSVPGIAFSPDGRRLASVGKERGLKLWDATNGALVAEGSHPLSAQGQAVCFSPDGRVVCTGDYQTSRLQFWEAGTGRKVQEVEDAVGGRTWSLQWLTDMKGGSRLIRASDFQERGPGVSTWRITSTAALLSGRPESCMPSEALREGPVLSLVASANGERLAYLAGDWTVSASRLVTSRGEALAETNVLSEKMPFAVQGLALTADGGRLVVGCGPTLSLLDVRTGQTIRQFHHDGERHFEFLALSTDERWLAARSSSALGVEIYDFNTGELRYRLPDREGTVYWLAWQPGAPRLAVARDNGALGIWDLAKVEQQLAGLELVRTTTTVSLGPAIKP